MGSGPSLTIMHDMFRPKRGYVSYGSVRGEESQIDPSIDAWDGIDEDSGDWHAA